MANPVKERVMVFFFKAVKEDVLEALRGSFEEFLKAHFGEVGFVNTRINRPTISRPKCTEGDVEPDWTKLKVGVNRLYRYETSDGRFMFQLSREFFSYNALDVEEGAQGAGSVGALLAFCESLNDFAVNTLVRRVKIEDAHYDTIYCVKQEELKAFLEQPRPTGGYDYYNVFKLFRNLGEGSSKDAWGFVSPLEQHFQFNKRKDNDRRVVEMDVKAGQNSKGEWYLEVKTACYAHLVKTFEDSLRKLRYMLKMLPEFEGCQQVLLGRVFSDSALKVLECEK